MVFSFIKSNDDKSILKNEKTTIFDKYRSMIASVPSVYHGVHENLTRESKGTVDIYSDRIEFVIIKKQFEIPISSIIDNQIVHQEQLTQRITATRMIAFGILSVAAPKKKNNISNYLTIEYEDQNIKNMLILKGNASFPNTANDLIIKLNAEIIKARKNHMANEVINH